ncbi:MAG: EthD domain-containing protein [Solirubrobacterales bacterium]
MIKVVAMLRRREGLTHEEFFAYYEEKHLPLAWGLLPDEVTAVVVHYVQNHARRLGGSEPPFDCVTEIGFADADGMRVYNEWYLGPGGAAIRADEDNFVDKERSKVLITDEHQAAFAENWVSRVRVAGA